MFHSTQPLLFYTAFLILLSLYPNAPRLHVLAAGASPVSFSFDFSSPSTYSLDDLRLEGDAAVHGSLVDLTSNSSLVDPSNSTGMGIGRMSYNHPVPLYDNTTGQVASFTTRFTFAFKRYNNSKNDTLKGDGMAFFLSSYPSSLPLSSRGGNLGLHNGDVAVGTNRFVAIEFDSWRNYWDPCDTYDHIAIDINTTKESINATCLPSFSMEGSMTASTMFDGSTNMLLATLHLDENPSHKSYQVSVHLPDHVTSLLPPEVAVGFSAATGFSFQYTQILSWSFDSILATHTETTPPEDQPKPTPVVATKGNAAVVIRGAVLSIAVLVGAVLLWFILSWYRWIRTRDSYAKGTIGLKRFEYSVLAAATGKFSEEKRLGEGAFGAVYGGSLVDENGREQEVAVKKIKDTRGETEDFLAELKTISETRHMNLVKLNGWCCSPSMMDVMCWSKQQNVKLFLVYELVSNGNLDYHLHRRDQVLPWPIRYHIVRGIASALHYLHHQCKPYILHRDIKPSNILLDDGFNAKLADFGLSRIANHNSTIPLTIAIGTEGYIDPQCRKHGLVKFGRRSDVYSFGIVLLDIACTGMCREQVWELYRSDVEPQVEAAADATLRGVFDRKQTLVEK